MVNESEIWAYVSGHADELTKVKVENWKTSNNFNKQQYDSITMLYNTLDINSFEDTIDMEAVKANFFTAVGIPNYKSHGMQKYLKYVAVFVLLLSFASIAFLDFSQKIITVETGYGEENQITLPDGSVVWLNSKSKISYMENYPRTIQLNGEAFFEVAKDKAHPFTVETVDNVTIKALGTSFNVKAYPNNTYLETTLVTGKIEVSAKNYFDDKIIMLPNDNIRINKTNGLPVKTTIKNKQNILSWREGKIRFENTSFEDIAIILNNQLNVKLVFKNKKIAKSRFTASFEKSTSIKEILEVFKASKNFKYNLNQEKNEWVIK